MQKEGVMEDDTFDICDIYIKGICKPINIKNNYENINIKNSIKEVDERLEIY
jgi:hypothetical protein